MQVRVTTKTALACMVKMNIRKLRGQSPCIKKFITRKFEWEYL